MSKTSTTTSSTIQRVQCEFCEKQFVNKAVLKKHINAIHRNIYLFKCPHSNCERTFRTGYRLYVHELFHKGIKPFKCSFCGKGFAEKGTLKVHQKSHSTIAKLNHIWENTIKLNTINLSKLLFLHFSYYKCSICKTHFNLKSDYTFHLKEHNLNGNCNNNSSNIETESSVASQLRENLIVKEIQFGVYVVNDK